MIRALTAGVTACFFIFSGNVFAQFKSTTEEMLFLYRFQVIANKCYEKRRSFDRELTSFVGKQVMFRAGELGLDRDEIIPLYNRAEKRARDFKATKKNCNRELDEAMRNLG